jgi:prepilin-type N-terminal cleavage/methylation domain-containing protein
MKSRFESGFSMIELAIVVLIFGLLLAFSLPAFVGFRERNMLVTTKENIAGQLRLARQTAIATGTTQTLHASENQVGNNYHLHNGAVATPLWNLPNGITYVWIAGTTQWQYRYTSTGRCLDSGSIILQDRKGVRDTVAVLASGLVLTK